MALADFSKWNTIGFLLQIILIIFGVCLMLYGIYEVIVCIKNPFDKDKLYGEIEGANLMREHPHSIALMKMPIVTCYIMMLDGIVNFF